MMRLFLLGGMSRAVITISIIFFLTSCVEPYREHISSRYHTFHTSTRQVESFDYELLIAPDKSVLTRLVSKIDHAEKRIWIETYIWTEKSLRDAVLRARDRGIDVRVLLE
jgi:phosphatidylserine/phosphatidylglycerophosphate/cardiolipin synthase-like enzyme